MSGVSAARARRVLGPALALAAAWLLAGCVTTVEGDRQQQASRAERVEAHLALARGYIEEGDWDRVRGPLEEALEIDSRSSETHALFGLLYQREGEPERAEEHYRRALRYDRDNPQALNNFGIFLYEDGRYDEAREMFERATSDTGYHARPRAYENLALTELERGELELAERAFMRALELDPERARSHLELAELYFQRGDNGAALEHYSAFRERARQNARSLWLGIRLHRAIDDMNAAASLALQLRNMYPGSEEYQRYRDRYE